jgi:hypothetical protein
VQIGPKVFLAEHYCNRLDGAGGFIRLLEIAAAKHGCRDGRSAGGSFSRAPSHPINWKRREADVFVRPGWTLVVASYDRRQCSEHTCRSL